MTPEERKEYIKYRIETAYKSYEAAIVLLKNKFMSAALNRLYYSVFYIVNALLVKNGIITKTHNGIKQQFSLNFVKKGIIDEKYGIILSKLSNLRQKADYGNYFEADKELVVSFLEPVKDMINEIEKLLTD